MNCCWPPAFLQRFATPREPQPRHARAECVFCSIAAGTGPPSQRTLLYSDARCVVFRDRAPAAETHLLVCSRAHIHCVNDLQGPADAELASHLEAVAHSMLDKHGRPGAERKLGYHANGWHSVDHLHLHAFALPHTPAWRVSWKYAGNIWWMSADAVRERLSSSGGGGTSYGTLPPG